MNNFVYTTRRSPGAACIAGRFSIVAVPIVAVSIFWLLSVTVLGRVGGAPAQGWGRPRASRAVRAGRSEAPGSFHCVLGVLLRMGMAVRRPSPAKKVVVSILGERKASSQNARHGVYEWKTALFFALRMHSSQPLQLEPAVCRRKLDLLPSER